VSQVRVLDIERAIAERFPLSRAEEWDRCGLLVGDPLATVTGVVLSLDVTMAAIEFAVEHHANVIVSHHPAFLKPPSWLTPGRGSAGVVFAALSRGIALINAHTNLDRDQEAQELLPGALGLTPLKPLERSTMNQTLVTVFAPESAASNVIEAMTLAGAGRVGDYTGCSFESAGTGRYTPGVDTSPVIGAAGEPTDVAEMRIEMIAPKSRVKAVVSAATRVHPYDEPLVITGDVAIARNSARLGMVCAPPVPTTVEELAIHAATVFGITPRVWGDRDTAVRRIVTATGSASSLIGEALSSNAQALIAGEVRYHDAVEAAEAGLAVIELGHDVSEWPLVALLERLTKTVEGIDPHHVHVMPATAGWWTPESEARTT
jgi:dinuclear metal center YbgI/SA1388 family protein